MEISIFKKLGVGWKKTVPNARRLQAESCTWLASLALRRNGSAKPNLLKEGGFFLIARPEASNYEVNKEKEKLSVGKIGKLLGALNREEFWTYTPPSDEEKRKKKIK